MATVKLRYEALFQAMKCEFPHLSAWSMLKSRFVLPPWCFVRCLNRRYPTLKFTRWTTNRSFPLTFRPVKSYRGLLLYHQPHNRLNARNEGSKVGNITFSHSTGLGVVPTLPGLAHRRASCDSLLNLASFADSSSFQCVARQPSPHLEETWRICH